MAKIFSLNFGGVKFKMAIKNQLWILCMMVAKLTLVLNFAQMFLVLVLDAVIYRFLTAVRFSKRNCIVVMVMKKKPGEHAE